MALFPLLLALVPAFEFSRFWVNLDPPPDFHALRPLEPVAWPVAIDSAAFRDQILGDWVYLYSTDGYFRRRMPTADWSQLGARLVFERVDEERVVKPMFYQHIYNARRGMLFEGIRYRIVDSTKQDRWRNDTCYPIGYISRSPSDSGVDMGGWCDSDKSADPTIRYLAGDTLVIDQGGGKLTVFHRR